MVYRWRLTLDDFWEWLGQMCSGMLNIIAVLLVCTFFALLGIAVGTGLIWLLTTTIMEILP